MKVVELGSSGRVLVSRLGIVCLREKRSLLLLSRSVVSSESRYMYISMMFLREGAQGAGQGTAAVVEGA